MKKLISIVIAALMIFSMSTTIFAAGTPVETTLTTPISVTGTSGSGGNATNDFTDSTVSSKQNTTYVGSDGSDYTITVPASLTTGGTGNINISGVWPTGSKLTMTADTSVTLYDKDSQTYSEAIPVTINGVTANKIELEGNSESAFDKTYSISVGSFAPVLGNWSGTITYNVTYTPGATATVPTQTYNFTYKDSKNTVYNYSFEAKENMTWEEFVASDHNTNDLFSLVYPEYKENGSEFTIIVFNSTDTVFCNGLTQVKSNTPLSQATEYFHAIEN